MTPPDKVNELNEAEQPAIELLQRLGYTYVPREILAAERDNEREVLLKGRLKAALLTEKKKKAMLTEVNKASENSVDRTVKLVKGLL